MVYVSNWRFKFDISKTRYPNRYVKFKIDIYKFKIWLLFGKMPKIFLGRRIITGPNTQVADVSHYDVKWYVKFDISLEHN